MRGVPGSIPVSSIFLCITCFLIRIYFFNVKQPLRLLESRHILCSLQCLVVVCGSVIVLQSITTRDRVQPFC
ncbi:uncharacterized protein V1518DRAFT_408026 [Limtongia smithiae]|uniref:uncharacterized protein n=1 Tax=Limtongia smithiae TaxID=1125753 RepID=UPI0034CF5449